MTDTVTQRDRQTNTTERITVNGIPQSFGDCLTQMNQGSHTAR